MDNSGQENILPSARIEEMENMTRPEGHYTERFESHVSVSGSCSKVDPRPTSVCDIFTPYLSATEAGRMASMRMRFVPPLRFREGKEAREMPSLE